MKQTGDDDDVVSLVILTLTLWRVGCDAPTPTPARGRRTDNGRRKRRQAWGRREGHDLTAGVDEQQERGQGPGTAPGRYGPGRRGLYGPIIIGRQTGAFHRERERLIHAIVRRYT